MTLPVQEKRSLKIAHELLRQLMGMKKKDIVNMPIDDFRNDIYHAIKHYPYDYRIDHLYELDKTDTPKDDRQIKHGQRLI